MPPVWRPEEAEAKLYEDVARHSEGMISFTYRPPTEAELEALKDTETYRSLMKERDGTSKTESPVEQPSSKAR